MKNLSAFITGTPRSGTTMLQLQLQKKTIPEATLLTVMVEQFKKTWPTYGEDKKNAFYWNNDIQECKDAFRAMAQTCVDNALKNYNGSDTRAIVLKCPEMSRHALAFNELFPDVPLFITMRDPHAVYLSSKNVRAKLEYSTMPEDVINGLRPYYEGLYQICSQDLPDNVYILKYEDLIHGDLTELKEIAKKHNLDLHLSGGEHEAFDENDPYITQHYGNKMSAEGFDRYKDELTKQEMQAVEDSFTWVLERFGYPRIYAPSHKVTLRAAAVSLLTKIGLYTIVKKCRDLL